MCIFQINMRQIGFIAMRISVGRFIYLFIRIRKKKWYRYMCVYVDYNKSYFGRLVTHAHRQIRVGCSFYIFHCCDVRIFASWLYSVKVYFIWILYNIYDFFFLLRNGSFYLHGINDIRFGKNVFINKRNETAHTLLR